MRPAQLLCIASVAIAACGCSAKWQLRRADKSYHQLAYTKAAERYTKVLPKLKKAQQPAVRFKLAECERLVGNASDAQRSYLQAMRNTTDTLPNIFLGLAKVQQAQENYADAVLSYEKYLRLVPTDTLAKANKDFCIALRDTTVQQTRYIVDNLNEFNSNKDDFAPCFAEDDYSIIYFTSSRDDATGRKPNIVTGTKSTDIFMAKQQRDGRWEKITPIPGEVNTKAEEGACTLSPNLRTLYFTQCVMRGGKVGCSICTAERDDETAEWTSVENLDIDSLYNVAHPTLAPDGNELVFASDMADGFGGMDLWSITREGESWGSPVNMGPDINSAGNDMYPFYRDDNHLYFASDGRAGYGGMDLYKATRIEGKGWKVENMGMPINSAADDISIIFERDRESGYFASQRKGGRGGADIYRFVLPEAKFMYIATVRDFDEGTPMAGVGITIINSADGESVLQRTESDGVVQLQLRPETDYLAVAKKNGFFNRKSRFSTKGLETITTLRDEFLMRSMASAVEVEGVLYDFSKWDLRPESENALAQLIEVLEDNPAITIEIMAHTDSRGDSTFNVELSQKRAQSVVDYLVAHGIDSTRLQAKGYGARQPRIVSRNTAAQYKNFLKEGDVLNDTFIYRRARNQTEEDLVDQLNRRTEFKVISTK